MLPDDEGMTVVEIEPEIIDSHDANLLETVFADEKARKEIQAKATEWITLYEQDLRSREQWEKTYREGLKLLGLQMEERTEPWEGACGVIHPLLTEAVVRFQSDYGNVPCARSRQDTSYWQADDGTHSSGRARQG